MKYDLVSALFRLVFLLKTNHVLFCLGHRLAQLFALCFGVLHNQDVLYLLCFAPDHYKQREWSLGVTQDQPWTDDHTSVLYLCLPGTMCFSLIRPLCALQCLFASNVKGDAHSG